MPYWIHENGETIGPMRAIDVLRRATPSTRVCDGEIWFRLDDEGDPNQTAARDMKPGKPERVIIRGAVG
jgi:hypothetical protein